MKGHGGQYFVTKYCFKANSRGGGDLADITLNDQVFQ